MFCKTFSHSLFHFTQHQPDEEEQRDYSTDFIGEETEAHRGIERMGRDKHLSQLTSQIPCEKGVTVLILQMWKLSSEKVGNLPRLHSMVRNRV